MKILFAVIFTLLLCGGVDLQEHFLSVDGRELNLRCSCSALMRNNRFFCLISNPSNETRLTTVIQVCEISPKNEPVSGPLLRYEV
jgi:hypothetical protein